MASKAEMSIAELFEELKTKPLADQGRSFINAFWDDKFSKQPNARNEVYNLFVQMAKVHARGKSGSQLEQGKVVQFLQGIEGTSEELERVKEAIAAAEAKLAASVVAKGRADSAYEEAMLKEEDIAKNHELFVSEIEKNKQVASELTDVATKEMHEANHKARVVSMKLTKKTKVKRASVKAPKHPDGDMWRIAKDVFAKKPYSNGHDFRYESVKMVLRHSFGEKAINDSNKDRLKALAVSRGKSDIDLTPIWDLAKLRFSTLPYSNGRDNRYEAVKNEIRFLFGKNSINVSNKARLKALALSRGCPELGKESQFTIVNTGPKVNEVITRIPTVWSVAETRFSTPPYSNGHDSRYEEVKKELRARFGADAINASNKVRLKALALSRGGRLKEAKDAISLKGKTIWEIAGDLFSTMPYSNGHDGRYEDVKKYLRKNFGKDAISSMNKQRFKALATSRGGILQRGLLQLNVCASKTGYFGLKFDDELTITATAHAAVRCGIRPGQKILLAANVLVHTRAELKVVMDKYALRENKKQAIKIDVYGLLESKLKCTRCEKKMKERSRGCFECHDHFCVDCKKVCMVKTARKTWVCLGAHVPHVKAFAAVQAMTVAKNARAFASIAASVARAGKNVATAEAAVKELEDLEEEAALNVKEDEARKAQVVEPLKEAAAKARKTILQNENSIMARQSSLRRAKKVVAEQAPDTWDKIKQECGEKGFDVGDQLSLIEYLLYRFGGDVKSLVTAPVVTKEIQEAEEVLAQCRAEAAKAREDCAHIRKLKSKFKKLTEKFEGTIDNAKTIVAATIAKDKLSTHLSSKGLKVSRGGIGFSIRDLEKQAMRQGAVLRKSVKKMKALKATVEGMSVESTPGIKWWLEKEITGTSMQARSATFALAKQLGEAEGDEASEEKTLLRTVSFRLTKETVEEEEEEDEDDDGTLTSFSSGQFINAGAGGVISNRGPTLSRKICEEQGHYKSKPKLLQAIRARTASSESSMSLPPST